MHALESQLAEAFRCPKCSHENAHVETLAVSGTRISRLFEVQPYRYQFVSCNHSGSSEIDTLTTLEGKDDLSNLLEILSAR